MAKRAAESRRRNKERLAAEEGSEAEQARRRVDGLPGRDSLSELAGAVVVDVLNKVLVGKIPVNGGNAKSIAEMAYSIVRLESGDPTTITGTVDREQLLGQIKSLRDAAQKRQQHADTSTGGATDSE
jgi:hypothetical protein